MGTLSSLLNLSLNALQASQAATNITSSNVANANTPGYTEETANWQEDRVSLSGSSSVGAGVSVTDVSQRDRVLEQRVQQQTQSQASASAESDALTQLQSVFGMSATLTSASSTTVGSDVNAFFNSLSSLQASPSSGSVRQAVLSAAQTLASDLNGASAQISSQVSSLNQQVTGLASQVNTLTASIANLNSQISSTSPTGDAGVLEDQRQLDLTQLSQLIGFNQTTTENNGITLTTTNGAPLVGSGQSYGISTGQVNGNTDVFSGGRDITAGIQGGQLGGVLQARDQDLPKFSAALDTLAYSIGSQTNTQNASGLNGYGMGGGPLFTLPSSATGAASSISVATIDPNAIAAAGPGEGSSGGSNAAALSALQNSTIVSGQTPSSFFASFMTQLGSAAASAANSSTVQQASLTQLTTLRSSLSSVSLDQEAGSLTQYQRSYEAAAKVFAIVDQLFASALNLGDPSTVS